MARNKMPQKSSSCCSTCTMVFENTFEAAFGGYLDSICPNCCKPRGEAHPFVKGEEVCPNARNNND